MHPLYDIFCTLCDELAVKNRIDPILADLYSRRKELEAVYDELKQIMVNEQADVERLKETSFASIFYTVIGQKDKKLEKEESEAFDAEASFREIRNQLDALNEEIKKYEQELRTVRGCDMRYGRVLPQILDEVRAIDSPDAKAVIDTVDSLARIEEKVAKFDEAIEISRNALNNAREAAKYIDNADKYARRIHFARDNSYERSKIWINLLQANPIIQELCRQIARFDASLVGARIEFEMTLELEFSRTNIDAWKIEIDCLIPQIEQIQSKMIPARDRWAKRVSELRIELQEQIKAVLE